MIGYCSNGLAAFTVPEFTRACDWCGEQSTITHARPEGNRTYHQCRECSQDEAEDENWARGIDERQAAEDRGAAEQRDYERQHRQTMRDVL